jgi:hypothetical protein
MSRIEHAMVQTVDGAQVRRPDAERSLEKFQRALAARGRAMPPHMKWSEERGFHYVSSGRSLAELEKRQEQVAREIRWEQLRLRLSPPLAALAAKLDQAMR